MQPIQAQAHEGHPNTAPCDCHLEERRQELETNEPMLEFFSFEHLPEHLKSVSRHFATLAVTTVLLIPRDPERTVALRKLLESKDAAVRAALRASKATRA